MAERADDRLVRLLGIVSFLDGAGGVPVEELASRFGVSTRQIVEDVDALWVSGTPGTGRTTSSTSTPTPSSVGGAPDRGPRHDPAPATGHPRGRRPHRGAARHGGDGAVRSDRARSDVVSSVLDKLTGATGEAAAALDVRLPTDGDPPSWPPCPRRWRTGTGCACGT
ncbi:hypothetical protein NKG05_28260 [Oerskovia sp. M15]